MAFVYRWLCVLHKLFYPSGLSFFTWFIKVHSLETFISSRVHDLLRVRGKCLNFPFSSFPGSVPTWCYPQPPLGSSHSSQVGPIINQLSLTWRLFVPSPSLHALSLPGFLDEQPEPIVSTLPLLTSVSLNFTPAHQQSR